MKEVVSTGKIIDADNFYERTVSMALVDGDWAFCDKVKYALDKQPSIQVIGRWEITGESTGALAIRYKEKKCSVCGYTHSLLIPDRYCPNCGMMNEKYLNAEKVRKQE